MFTKDNVITARYMNAENDTIEVLYKEDDQVHSFIFPARPTTSKAWKILKESGITTSKVKDNTIQWIKDQDAALYNVVQKYVESMMADTVADMQKDYDTFVEKTNDEMRRKYDAAVSDISTSVRTGKSDTGLIELLRSPTEEQIFELKVSILEDKSTFDGLTKAEEKTRRREIRKCMTVKDLIQYL